MIVKDFLFGKCRWGICWVHMLPFRRKTESFFVLQKQLWVEGDGVAFQFDIHLPNATFGSPHPDRCLGWSSEAQVRRRSSWFFSPLKFSIEEIGKRLGENNLRHSVNVSVQRGVCNPCRKCVTRCLSTYSFCGAFQDISITIHVFGLERFGSLLNNEFPLVRNTFVAHPVYEKNYANPPKIKK